VIGRHQYSQEESAPLVYQVIRPADLGSQPELKFNKQDSSCGCFNQESLNSFLTKLDTKLKESPATNGPIILDISGGKHTTAIIYFPNTQKYRFIDANYLSDTETLSEAINIAQKIWRAYSQPPETSAEDTVALRFAMFSSSDSVSEKFLLQTTKEANGFQQNYSSVNGEYLLDLAAKHGETETIKETLLQHPEEQITSQNNNPDNRTPLMIAASLGPLDAVKELLKHHYPGINLKDKNGATALMFAITSGNIETVREMLQHQTIDVNTKNNESMTALMFAVDSGNSEIIKELLKHPKIDINQFDSSGNSALLRAIEADPPKTEVIKILLSDQRTLVNLQQNIFPRRKGYTALMLAIQAHNTELTNVLLARQDIDVTTKNSFGVSALTVAAKSGNNRAVTLLLPKLTAQELNHTDSVFGNNALMWAATTGHIEVVRQLLEQPNININQENIVQQTALMLAEENGHTEIVTMLREAAQKTQNQEKRSASKTQRAQTSKAPEKKDSPKKPRRLDILVQRLDKPKESKDQRQGKFNF